MQIGTSLFLIALGAILKYAVNDGVKDVDLSTIGVILMIVGIVGLLISMLLMSRARAVVAHDRVVERDLPPRY